MLLTGWDSGVVHPFLSLLWSDNGQYLSEDQTKALFNSPEGLQVLNLYMDMIANKCIDPAIGNMTNFVEGKGGMMIKANFLRSDLQAGFVDGYENVGVAPIPTGPDGKSTTVQYNWLFGVDAGSKNKEEAWKLVQWLNSPAARAPRPPWVTT